MSTPIGTPQMRRRPGMAVAVVGAMSLSVIGMFLAGRDVRQKEGRMSPYNDSKSEGSDMRMNSSDVSAVVAVPKPGDKRKQES